MTQLSPLDKPATLHFGDGEYVVLAPGTHVYCAISRKPIPLAALRYWSAVWQEAYIGPAESLQADQERRQRFASKA